MEVEGEAAWVEALGEESVPAVVEVSSAPGDVCVTWPIHQIICLNGSSSLPITLHCLALITGGLEMCCGTSKHTEDVTAWCHSACIRLWCRTY